jgi:hypothetical protein
VVWSQAVVESSNCGIHCCGGQAVVKVKQLCGPSSCRGQAVVGVEQLWASRICGG